MPKTREEIRAYHAKWAREHPESGNNWRRANKVRLDASRARWRAANKERLAAEQRERRSMWTPEKRETVYALSREWAAAHPEYCRAKNHAAKCRDYGLTPAQYEALLVVQSGVCAICQRPETARFGGTTKRLAIDHEHGTGRVRGLLCGRCNSAIGLLDEEPERLLAAVAYLRR